MISHGNPSAPSSIDVYPAGSYDLPFDFKGLVPGYLVIYPLVTEVCDLLRAGLDNLARVKIHAREIIIDKGGRDVPCLSLILGAVSPGDPSKIPPPFRLAR